jgi:hypothetical protein
MVTLHSVSEFTSVCRHRFTLECYYGHYKSVTHKTIIMVLCARHMVEAETLGPETEMTMILSEMRR